MSDTGPDREQTEIVQLSEEQTARIEDQIEKYRRNLEDELGQFTHERLPTGRVLLLPRDEVPHVCYMSDEGPWARLCVDDYVPEIGDRRLNPERPSDDQ